MFTVSTSKKTPLNDQLYAQLHMHQPRRKMSLQTPVCTWSTFSKSLMASIAESQVIDWQYTNLTLVHHKVEVSEAYCRKSMLLQVLPPYVRSGATGYAETHARLKLGMLSIPNFKRGCQSRTQQWHIFSSDDPQTYYQQHYFAVIDAISGKLSKSIHSQSALKKLKFIETILLDDANDRPQNSSTTIFRCGYCHLSLLLLMNWRTSEV